ADAHYHLGLSYYRKAKFDPAIAEFQQTLKLLPRDVDARITLGMAFYKKGDASNAIEAYQRALEIDPNNVEALNNLGMAYDELGRFDDAIASYRSALKSRPDLAQLQTNLAVAQALKAGKYSLNAYRHYRRGQDFAAGGEVDTAIAEWKKAVADSPNYTQAYVSLADAYFNRGLYDAAAQSYAKASQLDANDPHLLYNLGNTYLRMGRFEAAVSAYQNALKIDPNMAYTYANMGFALFEMERYDEAIRAYKQALQQDATPALRDFASLNLHEVQFNMKTAQEIKAGEYSIAAYRLWRGGLDALNRGDIETVIERWKGAVAASPRYAQAHESLGWAYFNMGQFNLAIQEYQTALDIHPSPQARKSIEMARDLKAGVYTLQAYRLWEMGRQLSSAGKVEEAVEMLKRSLKESPNFAEACNTLAWLYADQLTAHLDEAESLVRKAIQLKPDGAHLYDTLGWVLYKQGRYAESVEAIEQAITFDGENGEYWYHASLAHLQNQQKAQALKSLKRAVALDSRFRELAQKEKAFASIRPTSAFREILESP
ncbi:tetratricopeptide repeat protein, partial [Candidatus Poribacteria bacterium]|nr:tetratricopeptide repeat protein [Candidatus Poribacteria bacterium]